MNKIIRNPYWGNQDKTQLVAEFVYEDGTVQTASIVDVAGGNPDWQQAMSQYSLEEIQANTSTRLVKHRKAQDKFRKEKEAESLRASQEALFAAKLDAFEIDLVKNSTSRTLKAGIRKSKTFTEVIAYTAALINSELAAQAAAAAAQTNNDTSGTADGTTV